MDFTQTDLNTNSKLEISITTRMKSSLPIDCASKMLFCLDVILCFKCKF